MATARPNCRPASTAAATLLHLLKTINGTGAAGTDYFAGSDSPNASASAAISGTNMIATALTPGSAGNSITSTQSITGGTDTWTAATLGGGSGNGEPANAAPMTRRIIVENKALGSRRN
jgi:hypothetical protein